MPSRHALAFVALCVCGALVAPTAAQAVGSHLFDVPINVNGALQVIDVKVGDSVQDLADAFCDNNALPRSNAAQISAAIVEQLQIFQAKRAAQEQQAEAQAQKEAQAQTEANEKAQAQAEANEKAQAQAEASEKAQAKAAAQQAAEQEANEKAAAARAAAQNASAQTEQRIPMFMVPVNAGERGSTSIPIFEGDVPKEVAAAFLARNNLPADLQGALVDGIMAQFREYQARQQRSTASMSAEQVAAYRSGEDKVLAWLIENYNGQDIADRYRAQYA